MKWNQIPCGSLESLKRNIQKAAISKLRPHGMFIETTKDWIINSFAFLSVVVACCKRLFQCIVIMVLWGKRKMTFGDYETLASQFNQWRIISNVFEITNTAKWRIYIEWVEDYLLKISINVTRKLLKHPISLFIIERSLAWPLNH